MKYHINSKGEPTICKATKQSCPLGKHFDTEKEALFFAEKSLENEFGLLPSNENPRIKERKDFADLIQRISGIKSNGFDYECFASVSLAQEMGLDKVAITDRNGLIINISMGKKKGAIDADVYVKRSTEGLKAYYEKMGISIKDETLLSRVVYYNEDSESILVQSGGPNVLDAAIIKADEVVDIIEVKRLGSGAQLPLISLDVDKEGRITEETLSQQSTYIAKALKDIKIQDADGINLKLDFGSEENNINYPLLYFVEEYKKKGATSFIYTTNDGDTINKIDLTRNIDEVVKELKDKNIEASVNLRANLQQQNIDKKDLYRFNKVLSKEYFKSGKSSNSESFTLKSIKEEKITKAGDFVRIGGYVLPIEYKDYKNNLNKRIRKTDMKAFRLSLTGNIKTHY
jgi:hypothetical protein